jgi:uncharacterized protein YprB with RNaseH-like and TPR domain
LSTAYLDIETSWSGELTVVGVYRPEIGTRQLVRPGISAQELRGLLDGVATLVTYNGSRFDLPVLQRKLGVSFESYEHRDLMFHCWRHELKGGLKKVEQALGLHRDTEGIDGLAAMRLWEAHVEGDAEALEVLLRYNREDIENLETVQAKLEQLDKLYPERVKRMRRKVAHG